VRAQFLFFGAFSARLFYPVLDRDPPYNHPGWVASGPFPSCFRIVMTINPFPRTFDGTGPGPFLSGSNAVYRAFPPRVNTLCCHFDQDGTQKSCLFFCRCLPFFTGTGFNEICFAERLHPSQAVPFRFQSPPFKGVPPLLRLGLLKAPLHPRGWLEGSFLCCQAIRLWPGNVPLIPVPSVSLKKNDIDSLAT